MEHQFDELAKALAGGLSRREALRRLGGGLAVSLLATLGVGKAWGQNGAVSCGSYCSQRLPPGRERGRCAASCDSCQSSGGVVCGTSVGGSVLCCSGGPTSTCCNGACVDTTADPNNCGGCGRVCSTCVNGGCWSTCAAIGSQCGTPGFISFCGQAVSGEIICRGIANCWGCTTNAECGLGHACFNGCCAGPGF
jgi:hypothetical protein